MRRYVFCILIINLFYTLPAQIKWAPVGAKWYYGYIAWGPNLGYVMSECVKDTMISGVKCALIINNFFSAGDSISIRGDSIIIKQINDKIFVYRNKQFYLIYDFSKKAGDTIRIPVKYMEDSVVFVIIDSVQTKMIGAENIKIQYTHQKHSVWYFSDINYEKIGNEHYFLPIYSNFCDVGCPDKLRCYTDSSMNYNVSKCDYTYSQLMKSIYSDIDLNIVNGILYIKTEEIPMLLEIYDCLGRSILNKKIESLEESIDISFLQKGLFFIRLTDLNEKKIIKKIII